MGYVSDSLTLIRIYALFAPASLSARLLKRLCVALEPRLVDYLNARARTTPADSIWCGRSF